MAARLLISGTAYALQLATDAAWATAAVLPGGAEALLGSTRPVDEARLEAAIEVAEDWLMPHARRLRGEMLEVLDGPGRLRAGLQEVLGAAPGPWSVDELESMFLRLVDMATGRPPSRALEGRHAFAADVVLLRELAHHGQLASVRLA